MAWADSHDYTVGDMRQLTHDGLLGDDQASAPENQVTLSEPGKLSAEFLAAIARSKGRQPAKDIAEVNASQEILAVSAQMNNTQNTDKTPAPVIVPPGGPYQIGQLIAGKGVYFGVMKIKNSKDKIVKKFNMFAAPFDLGLDENGQGQKLPLTYDDAADHTAGIRNYMGHDGANYNNANQILKAIYNGEYNGEWFIPPSYVMTGITKDGKKNDNLHRHRGTGAFEGTFTGISHEGKQVENYSTSSSLFEDWGTAIVLDIPNAVPVNGYEDLALTRLMRVEPL